jgi:hypothetical protein
MKVKAQFKVVVDEKSYPVVVRYEPHEFVIEIKKLIVAELKSGYDGFDSAAWGYLTLKTLDGDVIIGDELPTGNNKFLAELSIPNIPMDQQDSRIQGGVDFRWRPGHDLVGTPGKKWAYQSDPAWKDTLKTEIQNHFDQWRNGSFDKQSHPLFLCPSGAGTGKSRLLDEFPGLLRRAVYGCGELEQMIAQAYVFKLTFENGTQSNPLPVHANVALGTRMLYQLQDSYKWDQFSSIPSYWQGPNQVIELLSKL